MHGPELPPWDRTSCNTVTVIDADEILVMQSGQITARGTRHQLIKSSQLYRDLVHSARR
jgi:ABC-type transport system involved in Fe-S cluster assembly fused permease/ATPase subunit